MGSRSQVVPPPPPGFVLSPPPGFVLEGEEEPKPSKLAGAPPPLVRPPFKIGVAPSAVMPVSETEVDEPLLPLTKLFPEGPPTATVSLPRRPSRFGPQVALPGQGVRPDETVDFPIGGVARGVAEVAESLSIPSNIAILAGAGLTAGALPLVSRIISGGFSIHMVTGMAEQYPELREAINSGDEQRTAQIATRMGLTALLAALAGTHAVRGKARVSARPEAERAAGGAPERVSEPLPAPQPVSAREAADLGIAAERVPEVLRRQRETEAVTARAAERQPPRPSPILEELPPPPEGFVLEKPGVLPGMERAVREQKAAARALEGEKLGEEFARPVEERAGKPIEAAPIFRGTEAAPQREMFAPKRTAVDEFGDTIERGGRVVDSMGRSGKVTSVGALVQDLETGKAVFREDTLKVDFGKGPEPVSISEVTVKRHGRPKALEGIGRKPVRLFGDTEIAFHERILGDLGRIYSNPLIPLGELYTRLIGRPAWEKGVGLLWRLTPKFIQRAIRIRPELIKENVPGGAAYVEARREARGFIAEKAERGFELGERLTQKFSVEEQQALGRMVKGEARPQDLAKLRQDAAWNDAIEAAKDARTEFDNLGSQAVMQGLLRDETFFRNYGKYMPRLYRKYELPYEELAKQFGERKPTRLELSRFKQRKDIPEHIRMMMGEILEPGLPVAKGIAQIGHDVANMRLFNTVADNPLWASRSLDTLWRQEMNPADFVQMPTTAKLGRLSGSWVNKYIADDLNQIIRARTELEKISRALVGEWKFSKVILNPATHGRNLMSNAILAHAGGLPMTRVDIYYRALRELKSRGEIYREAKTASQGRMGRGTYAAAEFELLLDSWNKNTGGLGDRFAAMSQALKEGKPSAAFKQVRISGTRFGKGAARIYQAEEEWFKLAKYIHNKEKGMAPKEAWLDAEKWLFDYSEVPTFIDWSRQSPLGAPFITFTYKALPVIAESIVTAPWRIGSVLATLYYLNDMSAAMLGLTERQRKELEAVLPERMKGRIFGVPKFILLPWRDRYGQVQYLDLTYILPWGDIGETGGLGRELVEKIPFVRRVAGLTRQLPLAGSPLVQAFAEIGLNKSSFTDKEIYHPWESKAEVFKKVSLYLWRQVAPSLAPGGYGETRLRKAITQEPDYMGRTTSVPAAAASALLGLKITPIDPRLQRIYRRAEKERTIRDIEMQVGRVRRNRGLKGPEKAREIRRLRSLQLEIRRQR